MRISGVQTEAQIQREAQRERVLCPVFVFVLVVVVSVLVSVFVLAFVLVPVFVLVFVRVSVLAWRAVAWRAFAHESVSLFVVVFVVPVSVHVLVSVHFAVSVCLFAVFVVFVVVVFSLSGVQNQGEVANSVCSVFLHRPLFLFTHRQCHTHRTHTHTTRFKCTTEITRKNFLTETCGVLQMNSLQTIVRQNDGDLSSLLNRLLSGVK